jgi:hypothetical protein
MFAVLRAINALPTSMGHHGATSHARQGANESCNVVTNAVLLTYALPRALRVPLTVRLHARTAEDAVEHVQSLADLACRNATTNAAILSAACPVAILSSTSHAVVWRDPAWKHVPWSYLAGIHALGTVGISVFLSVQPANPEPWTVLRRTIYGQHWTPSMRAHLELLSTSA